jgi:3-oxoacyl-[acyl-carrier protein] reductase
LLAAKSEGLNRVVLITGGGSGIGKAMAAAFIQNGDRAVILGRREETLRAAAAELGEDCAWQRADVSQREQVVAAVQAIVGRFGKVDVLVNNAGYPGYTNEALPLEQAEAVWNEAIAVNLTGAYLMSLAAAPHLTRPGGRVINISSSAALTGGVGLRLAGYTAAKAGLISLTRALALEYGPQGITVNVIAPGFIPGTDMNSYLTDEIIQGVAAQIPVRRPGRAEDVAAAALFLASPQAGFITGELLNVNGGQTFAS